jgi:hypothetical protein
MTLTRDRTGGMDKNRFNFTKDALDRLTAPAPGERDTHYDRKTTGLQLRVTPTGTKTFSVYRRIKGGQPERVTLGRYPMMTIEQARKHAADINAAIEGGANPANVKRAHKAEPTFHDLFQQYLERHAKVNKRTWAEDAQRYKQYVEKPLGKKKLSAIERDSVATIHSEITMAGHPAVANRVLALISSVFGRAIEFGLWDKNPAKGIRRNKEASRDRFLISNELPRFFQALADEPNEVLRDYFLFALLTGARRSNVLTMRWRDVNLDDSTWRIPETKNRTPHTITLSPEAVEILRNRKDKNQ